MSKDARTTNDAAAGLGALLAFLVLHGGDALVDFTAEVVRISELFGDGDLKRDLGGHGAALAEEVPGAPGVEGLSFCIATDATGVLVQPIPGGDQVRRACKRAHFLVQIADNDHVFFEFLAKETSATIGELFRGFSGYVQADAKSVYNFLYKPPGQRPPPDDDAAPDLAERAEVGCWAHARRKFWEAAITTKDVVAREGLLRIKRVFDLDRTWKNKPATEIKALRDLHLRPHTHAFFAWAREQYELVKDRRGMLRSALGYAVRQEAALVRFFDDGRLKLTNNASERELRRIATGRRAWLFVGSEDHGQAAGNLLTLIASARLHGPRLRGLPARSVPSPAPLAQGALPRARSEILACHQRPLSSRLSWEHSPSRRSCRPRRSRRLRAERGARVTHSGCHQHRSSGRRD